MRVELPRQRRLQSVLVVAHNRTIYGCGAKRTWHRPGGGGTIACVIIGAERTDCSHLNPSKLPWSVTFKRSSGNT
ncbi:unnamed protein product [Cylicocyclus nassatus]|uniref:Uncharacterized protein n=1 Tax=Cylicocyclus nassatus TaxID=53992 RepID=A0AA36DPS8_CYLNA|nr:unnamed protein product [Cylicocyclus nassatus]